MSPVVSVPVLSKTTTCVLARASRAEASRKSTLLRAASPVPAIKAVGVARPKAQGQAITKTDTACNRAVDPSAPKNNHAANVISAMIIMAGTKNSVMRSTRFCTGAFEACAASMLAMILASTLSAGGLVSLITKRPLVFMEPPIT